MIRNVIVLFRSEPHYGWVDAIGNSSQLLAIEPEERPPGVFPDINFNVSSSSPPDTSFGPPSSKEDFTELQLDIDIGGQHLREPPPSFME